MRVNVLTFEVFTNSFDTAHRKGLRIGKYIVIDYYF